MSSYLGSSKHMYEKRFFFKAEKMKKKLWKSKQNEDIKQNTLFIIKKTLGNVVNVDQDASGDEDGKCRKNASQKNLGLKQKKLKKKG